MMELRSDVVQLNLETEVMQGAASTTARRRTTGTLNGTKAWIQLVSGRGGVVVFADRQGPEAQGDQRVHCT